MGFKFLNQIAAQMTHSIDQFSFFDSEENEYVVKRIDDAPELWEVSGPTVKQNCSTDEMIEYVENHSVEGVGLHDWEALGVAEELTSREWEGFYVSRASVWVLGSKYYYEHEAGVEGPYDTEEAAIDASGIND